MDLKCFSINSTFIKYSKQLKTNYSEKSPIEFVPSSGMGEEDTIVLLKVARHRTRAASQRRLPLICIRISLQLVLTFLFGFFQLFSNYNSLIRTYPKRNLVGQN